MSPKEKAEELIEKFSKSTLIFYDRVGLSEVKYEARRCALITVDECLHTCVESMIYYWREVKEEIENQ